MALERERRFLVKGTLPIDSEKMLIIKQGYFIADYFEQLRIRLTYHNNPFNDDKPELLSAVMCHKKHINETDREEKEWNLSLPRQVIDEMYETTKWKINKTRAIIDRWEVDLFDLPTKDSLIIAEIEYSDENPFPDKLPSWVGDEVTGMAEFANPVLAKQYTK